MNDLPSGAPGLHTALIRNTGYLLSRMGTFTSKHFAEKLDAVGLTPRMWGALNVLDHEGAVSQQQLGRSIAMDPSSMVAAIDELESKGLVERRPHPTDRRAHALHVTVAGHRTLKRGRELAIQAQGELLAPLNQDERRQLHELLLRLAVAAGAVGQPPAH
jgi:DNA-binding MarR family transcriptional regulator